MDCLLDAVCIISEAQCSPEPIRSGLTEAGTGPVRISGSESRAMKGMQNA